MRERHLTEMAGRLFVFKFEPSELPGALLSRYLFSQGLFFFIQLGNIFILFRVLSLYLNYLLIGWFVSVVSFFSLLWPSNFLLYTNHFG